MNRRASIQYSLSLWLIAGCHGGGGDSEKAVRGLNGTVILTSCTPEQEARLTQALQLAKQWLNDSRMQGCLEDSFPNGGSTNLQAPLRGAGYPEYILWRMREDMATNLICDDDFQPSLAVAVSIANSNPEKIFVRKNQVLARTVDDWASTLLHEAAHTKTFHHFDDIDTDPERNLSVNLVLEQCAAGIRANVPSPKPLYSRSALTSGEIPLAPVGLDVGPQSFNVACVSSPSGVPTSADGLSGATDANGIRRLGLSCKIKDRADGGTYLSVFAGAQDVGTSFKQACPEGEVMVGLYGQSQERVNSMGAICANETYVFYKIPYDSPRQLPTAGNSTGLPWRRMCPLGMSVKAVRGRHSNVDGVKQMDVVCQDYSKPERYAVGVNLTSAGGPGHAGGLHEVVDLECPGRSVGKGIHGVFPPPGSTGQVSRLGVWCEETSDVAGFMSRNLNGGFPTASAGNPGSLPSQSRSEVCPDDPAQAMVGLAVNHDGVSVRGIQSLCGSLRNWGRAGTTVATLPVQGTTTGTWQTLLCLTGSYLNGIRVEVDGYGVNRLSILCRRFSSRRTLVQDFTGDGHPDILVGFASTRDLFVWYGAGNGTWLVPLPVGVTSLDRSLKRMFAIGDFYGDGNRDIVGQGTDNVLYLYERGPAGWKSTTGKPLGDFSGYDLFVGPRDLDNDGAADMVARKTDGTLWFWKGTGYNTNWWPGTPTQIDGLFNSASVISAGDFDSDDKPDLLVSDSAGKLWLYSGDGHGGFSRASNPISTAWDAFDATLGAGDFDSDGHADVLARKPDGTLWLYRGDGTGAFKPGAGTQIGSGFQAYATMIATW